VCVLIINRKDTRGRICKDPALVAVKISGRHNVRHIFFIVPVKKYKNRPSCIRNSAGLPKPKAKVDAG
jgi:hypothetical protein